MKRLSKITASSISEPRSAMNGMVNRMATTNYCLIQVNYLQITEGRRAYVSMCLGRFNFTIKYRDLVICWYQA